MFVITCPNCAQPTPASLSALETMECSACSYSGPLTEEAVQSLVAAANMVRSLDSRQRQLSGFQRRAGSSSGCMMVILVLMFLFVGLPALVFAGVGLWLLADADNSLFSFAFLITIFSPLLLLLALCVPSLMILRRSRQRLLIATAARPPVKKGEAGRCRICGASLMHGSSPVVRCEFCESDNVLGRGALKQQSVEQQSSLDDFQRAIKVRSDKARKAAFNMVLALFAALLGGPISVVLLFFGSAVVLGMINAPPDQTIRYGLVQTEHGRCAASVYQHSEGDWIVNFWGAPPEGQDDFSRIPTLSELQVVDAPWFVGREVSGRSSNGGIVRGAVARVASDAIGARNYATIGNERLQVSGLCLVEEVDE